MVDGEIMGLQCQFFSRHRCLVFFWQTSEEHAAVSPFDCPFCGDMNFFDVYALLLFLREVSLVMYVLSAPIFMILHCLACFHIV